MNQPPAPRDMVRSGLCIGCGSCVAQAASADAEMRFDGYGQLRPAGSAEWLRTSSARLSRTCPFSPLAQDEDALAAALFPHAPRHDGSVGRYEAAYVGHVAEQDFRHKGSSGGMTSWVAAELLRRRMVDAVAHVTPADPAAGGRFFRYRISRSIADVRAGAQSRYYPVELSQVLATIFAEPGRYAVVGIPCFIKAIQLLRREHPLLRERIRHTLGLFCGHMKSARFVEGLAWQMGVAVDEVARVDFRSKDPHRQANWYHARLRLHDGRSIGKDWWHLADGDWGAGFFMDAACNACDDVVAETADISFGDAWVEPYASDWQGNNVVVVRSPELAALVADGIADGRLALAPVDSAFVARTQAAGLRQRREGLAYRLARRRGGVRPRKRFADGAAAPALRRKLIYAMRAAISRWSHRVFRFACFAGRPGIYLRWARVAAAGYHAVAYHRGRTGALVRRLGLR